MPSPDPRPLASHRLSTQGLLGARHRRQGDSSASLLPFLAPAVSYPPCRCDLDAVAAMRPNPLAAYSLQNIVLAAWPFPKIRSKRCGQVFKTGRQKRKTAEILQKRRNKQHSSEQVAFRKKRKVLMRRRSLFHRYSPLLRVDMSTHRRKRQEPGSGPAPSRSATRFSQLLY